MGGGRFGGDGSTIVVSESIMCTTPYKQAVQQSITQITPTVNPGNLHDAMKLALGLLGSDARYAGHIFVISWIGIHSPRIRRRRRRFGSCRR